MADGPPVRDTPSPSQSIPAAPSMVGEILDGRYRITRKLGEGGMGEVYAAEHVHIEKKFAIKLLRPEIVSNLEASQRFRQEARSASSIGHRNIIGIDDFGQLPDGRIYMCMELLNGAALNDLIQTPQPVDRLLNILIQTGHGLAAAHAKGIVHRDMKPENIFVTIDANNQDVPKLLDFGIAKVSGNDGQNNLTRTGTIFGTPFYMAPEQALGNPVDARTDIYAIGVIMYEVFAGSLPFQGESFMGILTQHITTEPEPVAQRAAKANRHLPHGLAEIITRCMQKNPAQRFSTMDELVNALVQIYRGVAGPGMSTYMEAFPVSARMPAPTPAPLTGPVGVPMTGPNTATVAAQPPPGHQQQMHPSAGYQTPPMPGPMPTPMPMHGHGPHTPSGPAPALSSSSGLYDPNQSATAVPKKSKVGLIVALITVVAVGGGIAAVVVITSKKKEEGGGGEGPSKSGTPKLAAAAFIEEYEAKGAGKKIAMPSGESEVYPDGVTLTGEIAELPYIPDDYGKVKLGDKTRLHLSFEDGGAAGKAKDIKVGDTITATCRVSGADATGIGLFKCVLDDVVPKSGGNVAIDAGEANPPPADAAPNNNPPTDAAENVPPPADATVVPEVKLVAVKLVVRGVSFFDVYEGDKKVFEGPGDIQIPEGEAKKYVVKAKGFKDKTITLDGKKKKLEIKMDRVGGSNPTPGSNTPDRPKLDCATKLVDQKDAACRKQFCAKHPDELICTMQ